MARLMKFLHTVGAIGFAGSIASLLILFSFLPSPETLAEYARVRASMSGIASWIFLPSLGVTVISGLLAFVFTNAFQTARWALLKLAFGILLFEGSLLAVHGPILREAQLSAAAFRGQADVAQLGAFLEREWISLWVLLAVAIANIVLGIWRPRLRWEPNQQPG